MHFSLYRLPFGTYIRLPTSNIQSRMARTYESGSTAGRLETACHYNMSKSIQCFNSSTTTSSTSNRQRDNYRSDM